MLASVPVEAAAAQVQEHIDTKEEAWLACQHQLIHKRLHGDSRPMLMHPQPWTLKRKCQCSHLFG